MKYQHLTGKKELDEFCEQFAYDTKLQYPHKQKRHKIGKSSKYYSKKSRKHKYVKNPNQPQIPSKGKPKYSQKKSKSTIKCYKCGQIGHYANRCKSKLQQKLNELSIDNEIQQQILRLLSDESDTSSDEEDEITALYSSGSESESDNSPEICECKNHMNQISDEVNYWKAIVEMNECFMQ
ncbi:uncharacterized protein LOC114306315 [Camellia sinensis]|uniref:uncharacterized protein LOC114306315 n=1 Tax=Camellia sinensis TaxID=4442 RepID=UPI0010357AE8|nr:uncharacterized protein LOC114306315 [Camellia sinensis]